MITEKDVGILTFLNKDNPGFLGSIKERFSDFNVNEITKDGTVVRLTSEDIPSDENQGNGEDDIQAMNYSDLPEECRSLVTSENYEKIIALATRFSSDQEKNGGKSSEDSVELNISQASKEGRKAVHLMVKQFSCLDSNTVDKPAPPETDSKEPQKWIIIEAKGRGQKQRGKAGNDRKGRPDWPRDRPRYLHFGLYKMNVDTHEAISLIARRCRQDEKRFGFAGTKDRRGRTCQMVSASLISAKQVMGAARALPRIFVGNFSYNAREIRLGDLSGNRFSIVIRSFRTAEQGPSSSPAQEEVEDALRPWMDSLSSRGFINYFGMQRFGTTSVPTHKIGLALLKSDWSGAIDLILSPRDESDRDLGRARKIYHSEKDAKKALGVLRAARKDRTIEGKLLFGLTNHHSNDKVNALNVLPRPTRQMYCHAYQSYVWNRVVSRRIETYGETVLVGDLTRAKSKEDDLPTEAEVSVVTDPSSVSIHDVVLPIPGAKVVYPKNELAEWYDEILREDGLSADCWSNSVKDYFMPGDYRKVIVKPTDVAWRTIQYSDPQADLLPTEWPTPEMQLNSGQRENGGKNLAPNGQDGGSKVADDKMASDSKDGQPPHAESKSENDSALAAANGEHSSDKRFLALHLEFNLQSSSYATMVLREVLHIATDKQSLMSHNHVLKEKEDTTKTEDGAKKEGEIPEKRPCDDDSSRVDQKKPRLSTSEEITA